MPDPFLNINDDNGQDKIDKDLEMLDEEDIKL